MKFVNCNLINCNVQNSRSKKGNVHLCWLQPHQSISTCFILLDKTYMYMLIMLILIKHVIIVLPISHINVTWVIVNIINILTGVHSRVTVRLRESFIEIILLHKFTVTNGTEKNPLALFWTKQKTCITSTAYLHTYLYTYIRTHIYILYIVLYVYMYTHRYT